MKKIVFMFTVLMFITVAKMSYADTYSKAMFGLGFGNEDVCISGGPCFNDGSNPSLDTDRGYYFYVVPVAVRKAVQGDMGLRLESEFSVSKREFDLEQSGEYSFKVDGDDTRYSFGGNVLLDVRLKDLSDITPYVGVGTGVEYSKLSADFSMRGRTMQASTHDDFRHYWKYIAGVEVPIVGNVKGNIEYNYRKTNRFMDNDSPVNWRLDDEHIVNAGLSLYW